MAARTPISGSRPRVPNVSELGYTPFEYWKGPKPVMPKAHYQPRNSVAIRKTGPVSKPRDPPKAPREPFQEPLPVKLPVEREVHYLSSLEFDKEMADSRPPTQAKSETGNFDDRPLDSKIEFLQLAPAPFDSPNSKDGSIGDGEHSKWNPMYWRTRTWLIVSVVTVTVVTAIIIGIFFLLKANRYPNYSPVSYSLAESYKGITFFDNFDYITGYDPGLGFVHYVPQAQATSLNLTYATKDSAILRVDTSVGPSSSPDASTGRFSVRIESKTQYNEGLFIFDIKHSPYGCGTWPALWFSDPSNWPYNGEIDIMEAVNTATTGNQVTLHTNSGCDMSVKRLMSGTSLAQDCNNATNANAGCGVSSTPSTYGTAFNNAGGGIMAMEWRDAGIRVWQFGRNSVPSDITAGVPDPSTWPLASADFPGTDCDIASHFKNQSIIANIDLCGTWAGDPTIYGNSGCPSTCTDFVANYPSNFTEAYWEFGPFLVYQANN